MTGAATKSGRHRLAVIAAAAITLIVASLAHDPVAQAAEPAPLTQREAEVNRLEAQLNAVPPAQLKTAGAQRLIEQLAAAKKDLERSRRLADANDARIGEASRGDPILDNEAVRAFTAHKLLLEVLADRARVARREYDARLSLLDASTLTPAGKAAMENAAKLAADGERRLSATSAAPRPFDADADADYQAAVEAYARATATITALLPPSPAEAAARIPRDGEHLLPTGADMLAAGRALSDRKIQITAVIQQISAPFDPKGYTELLTEDGRFRILLRWDACPDSLRQQFSMRSTGPRAMQKGTRLWLEGTITTFEGNDRCYMTPTAHRRIDAAD